MKKALVFSLVLVQWICVSALAQEDISSYRKPTDGKLAPLCILWNGLCAKNHEYQDLSEACGIHGDITSEQMKKILVERPGICKVKGSMLDYAKSCGRTGGLGSTFSVPERYKRDSKLYLKVVDLQWN